MPKPFYQPPPADADVITSPHQVWDQALVCLNGHVVNDRYRGDPTRNSPFCSVCGAASVAHCEKCNAPVPGFYYEYRRTRSYAPTGTPLLAPPQFCEACGSAFPWTERRIEAAMEYVDEFSKLSADERAQLAAGLDELIKQTPRQAVAAMRVQTLLAKAGAGAAKAVRDILVDVLSKAAKDQVFGPGS